MKSGFDAADEFVGVDLGDARRAARVRQIVTALQGDPGASFPKALQTVAAREGFYRLVNNEAVSLDALVAPHGAQTIARARQEGERPIVALDKTKFVFEGEGERDGLTRLSGNKQGYEAMVALALSASRRAHGVVAVEILESDGGSSADEWQAFVTKAGAELEGAKLRPIYVMDREADAYALFSDLIDDGRDFVIRMSSDRFVREYRDGEREPLQDLAARMPVMLTRTVRINRRKTAGRTNRQRAKHPPRVSREATLSVRASEVALPRTRGTGGQYPDHLLLNVVQVIELDPPDGEVPVEWFLITPLPIATSDGVEAIVDAYRARWVIEEYFKALKTGCKYESRQLESRHALLNTLGLLIPVAWRLLELRTIGEEEPEALANDVLDADEIHVLRRRSRDIKLGPSPTVYDAMLAIASLGGHIRQNGRPGWQTLFLGFQELQKTVDGYRLAKDEM